MSVTEPTVRPRGRSWTVRLGWTLVLLVLLTGIRLAYPTLRHQTLKQQLTARQFQFRTISFTGRSWRDLINWKWLPRQWRAHPPQEINISNPRGKITVEESRLLEEFVSFDPEGIHSPSRSWFVFTLENATDEDLSRLPERIRLIQFRATGQGITDDGMQYLQESIYLRSLAMNSTRIGDRGLSYLTRHTDLHYLQLHGHEITNAGLVYLKGMHKLDTLVLSGSQIDDAGLIHLAALPNLRQLNLADTLVTDAGLKDLAKLTRLTKLVLSGTRITDAGLSQVNALPPRLFELEIQRTQVTHECALKLWNANSTLRIKQ